MRSSTCGASVTRARPLTRSVWSRPGIMNNNPAEPVSTMLRSVSRRLLPVASGIARKPSSSTVTKPGGPPRGVASARPSASWDATTTSGDAAISARAASSSVPTSFAHAFGFAAG